MTRDDFQASAGQKDKSGDTSQTSNIVTLTPPMPRPALRAPAPPAPAPRGFGPKVPYGMPSTPMMPMAVSIRLLPTLVHNAAAAGAEGRGDTDEK